MDTNQTNQPSSRKKFLFLGISAVALFSVFKFSFPKNKKKKNTVKMLTREGKLVEIDQELIKSSKKKITNAELKEWIKK
jgi:hypothetical protein